MKQWNNSVVNWWMFLLGISWGYRETKKNTGIQQWCRVAGAKLDDYDIIITDSSLELTQLKSKIEYQEQKKCWKRSGVEGWLGLGIFLNGAVWFVLCLFGGSHVNSQIGFFGQSHQPIGSYPVHQGEGGQVKTYPAGYLTRIDMVQTSWICCSFIQDYHLNCSRIFLFNRLSFRCWMFTYSFFEIFMLGYRVIEGVLFGNLFSKWMDTTD